MFNSTCLLQNPKPKKSAKLLTYFSSITCFWHQMLLSAGVQFFFRWLASAVPPLYGKINQRSEFSVKPCFLLLRIFLALFGAFLVPFNCVIKPGAAMFSVLIGGIWKIKGPWKKKTFNTGILRLTTIQSKANWWPFNRHCVQWNSYNLLARPLDNVVVFLVT